MKKAAIAMLTVAIMVFAMTIGSLAEIASLRTVPVTRSDQAVTEGALFANSVSPDGIGCGGKLSFYLGG